MLEKVNRVTELYDTYQDLLTKKQKEYFELYYFDDLSLSEIADEYNISRNAVFDNIKRTQKLLEDYETKLKVVQNREARFNLIEKIHQLVQDESVIKLIEELQLLD
ncbi:MAG: YlxM family DNA-binding protein [Turicibacter sp.]